MDRKPHETDADYRERLINLSTKNLTEADKILLAAKISALSPQGNPLIEQIYHSPAF